MANAAPVGIGPYVERASDRIERYFRDVDRDGDALVIGVFGEWGSGKSTLLGEIRETIKRRAAGAPYDEATRVTLTVDFNPWRYEREEHLLVPLLKTAEKCLSDFVDGRNRERAAQRAQEAPAWRRALRARAQRSRFDAWIERTLTAIEAGLGRGPRAHIDWIGDRLVLLGACTIALTKMVKFKADIPLVGEVELAPYEALKAAQEQIDRGSKRTPAAHDQPQGHVSLYYDLYAQLRKLTRGEAPGPDGAAPSGEPGHLDFVFLIDDLDRCLPDKAVEMLEAIKLFLDVAGCVFILALDDEVVERGIAHRYRDYLQLGDRGTESVAYSLDPDRYTEFTSRVSGARLPPITGSEYLEKIIQVPFRLPRWTRTEAEAFLLQRFPALFPLAPSRDGRDAQPTPDAQWLLELFRDAIPTVPRKMVRAGELLEFVRGVALARNLRLDDYTLAQITLLQLFAPECFRFLRRDRRGAWLTLEKRMYAASLQRPAVDHLSNYFFDWWRKQCKPAPVDGATEVPVDRYTDSIELPFIDVLRQAANNRSGFDPRRLMLVGRSMRCKSELEPYFSLFLEPELASPDPDARRVAAPAQRAPFIDYLMGASPESWTQAFAAEPTLSNALLDDATFDEIVRRVTDAQGLLLADWLDVVAPHLSVRQLARLVGTNALPHELWARHRAPPSAPNDDVPTPIVPVVDDTTVPVRA